MERSDRKRKIYNINSKLPRKSTIIRTFKGLIYTALLPFQIWTLWMISKTADCHCKVATFSLIFAVIDIFVVVVNWGHISRFLKRCWDIFPD